MRVLGVGAHPDDLEILCAGTLAKYANDGHQIVMCHVCKGDKGHFHIPNDELARIRRKEAQLSASRIGAETVCLDLPDCEVFNDRPTLVLFIDLIRSAKPDIIITHSPTDYMPDHYVVSQLVYDASFHATLPNFKTSVSPHDKVAPMFYMDNVAGVDFEPTEYVDISDFIEMKKAMMECHQSQVVWLKEHDNLDIIDFIEACAKCRGLQCGVPFAEAFRPVNRWPRLRTERLLP
jgi:LmbE family N-acetylglucosaminyl deacetylase